MKKRTPFKNANMFFPALFVLTICAFICAVFFASCENLLHGGEDNASIGGGKKPCDPTPCALTVSVRIGGLGALARYAAPSMQQDFIYAALLYPDGSPSGELSVGNRDGSTITFLFQKPAGEVTENLTVKVLVFAKGTASSDFTEDVALLSGLKSGLKAEGGSITVDAITLTPNLAGDAPKGEVSLKVKVPDGYTLEIDGAEHGADQFSVDPSVDYYTIKQKDVAGISGGTYKLTFKVTKDGAVVYAFTDSINVWPGMCTDTWLGLPSGELGADGAREITQAMLAATVFVRGSGGWYDGSPYKDSAVASNDNPGSFLKPFATIQKAIDAVIAANDGASKYTIFVDGTLAYDGMAAQMANIGGANDRNLSLNIKALSDKATLDAKQSGRVMSINAAFAGRRYDITLENLVIMGGKHDNAGGGIYLNGSLNSLTLINCDVKGNTADNNGGGIFVSRGSILTMNGGTVGGSAAGGNMSDNGGGVYVVGTFTMSGDTTISGNEATSGGGGVYVSVNGAEKGVFTIGGNATINENSANSYGGGVWVDGTFTMNGGAISKNNAVAGAGGVYVANNGGFTMTDGTISGNSTDGDGGGVYVESSGTFSMNGGIVGDGNKTSDAGKGGGVFVSDGDFTMSNTAAVKGNEAKYGGGIYIQEGSEFKMNDGEISENHAITAGGGICISSGVANMYGGNIFKNEADSAGGGIYIVGDSGAFTMTYDATISDNTAYRGGGFYNAGATFIMKGDAKVSGNHITGGEGTGAYIKDTNSSTGVLKMSGLAQFGADDEVYLFDENNAIMIADFLTGTGAVATIEPRYYVVGRQVLSGGLHLRLADCSRFKVKPQSDGTTWSINFKTVGVNGTGVLVKGG